MFEVFLPFKVKRRKERNRGQHLELKFHISFWQMTISKSGTNSKLSRKQWVILKHWSREYITWAFVWMNFLWQFTGHRFYKVSTKSWSTHQKDSIYPRNYPKFGWLLTFCHLSWFPNYFIGLMVFIHASIYNTSLFFKHYLVSLVLLTLKFLGYSVLDYNAHLQNKNSAITHLMCLTPCF